MTFSLPALLIRTSLFIILCATNTANASDSDKPLASSLYGISTASFYSPMVFRMEDRHSQAHTIAAHYWSNENDKLAVVAHGYMDNCGYLKPVNRWFLQQGYDVICIELPGHGNSSGARADIDDMLVYLDVYTSIFPALFKMHYQGFVFFGHSTGNVGMVEYLLEGEAHAFDTVIFATPLIRSHMWDLSVFAYNTLGSFVSHVPRRKLHKDVPEYQALLKHDPAPIKSSPLNWFASLQRWNTSLTSDTRLSQEPVTIIFAGEDSVIDTKYNQSFLQKHFPNASIHVFAGSDHMLHYEQAPIKSAFFSYIQQQLQAQM